MSNYVNIEGKNKAKVLKRCFPIHLLKEFKVNANYTFTQVAP
jgi:hypothetical protein